LANQRQRTRGGIIVREGGDAAVRQWGGGPADQVRGPPSSPPFRRQAENAIAGLWQQRQQRCRPRQRRQQRCRAGEGFYCLSRFDDVRRSRIRVLVAGRWRSHSEADGGNALARSHGGVDNDANPPPLRDRGSRRRSIIVIVVVV
jgi:hypothetical protein